MLERYRKRIARIREVEIFLPQAWRYQFDLIGRIRFADVHRYPPFGRQTVKTPKPIVEKTIHIRLEELIYNTSKSFRTFVRFLDDVVHKFLKKADERPESFG